MDVIEKDIKSSNVFLSPRNFVDVEQALRYLNATMTSKIASHVVKNH